MPKVCGWRGVKGRDNRGQPKLTPFAAFGLTLVMILEAVFDIVRGEYNFVPINLVLGGVAAFIVYRRLFLRPIAPASISTWSLTG